MSSQLKMKRQRNANTYYIPFFLHIHSHAPPARPKPCFDVQSDRTIVAYPQGKPFFSEMFVLKTKQQKKTTIES